ncbi:hypothetical protein PENTCL1PPCAC_23654, partial [Pristionchus entomophagus]
LLEPEKDGSLRCIESIQHESLFLRLAHVIAQCVRSRPTLAVHSGRCNRIKVSREERVYPQSGRLTNFIHTFIKSL